MTRTRLDDAAIALGAGAILAALARFLPLRSDTLGADTPVTSSTPAFVSPTTMVFLLVLGAVAVAGGVLGGSRGRWLAIGAGVGLAAVAALILLQNVTDSDWLDGSRSAMALLGGLGVGLLAVGVTPRGQDAG